MVTSFRTCCSPKLYTPPRTRVLQIHYTRIHTRTPAASSNRIRPHTAHLRASQAPSAIACPLANPRFRKPLLRRRARAQASTPLKRLRVASDALHGFASRLASHALPPGLLFRLAPAILIALHAVVCGQLQLLPFPELFLRVVNPEGACADLQSARVHEHHDLTSELRPHLVALLQTNQVRALLLVVLPLLALLLVVLPFLTLLLGVVPLLTLLLLLLFSLSSHSP
mmetsp:Transcript_73893/g.186871  ORF Transcript_73893/g.186871 Transcript_73893/m.186871 type:complete len:226 (-) Transcript_73893:1024-1701(-)